MRTAGLLTIWGGETGVYTPLVTPRSHIPPGLTPRSRTHPLWTEGMTHACENTTLPQTSFADGN